MKTFDEFLREVLGIREPSIYPSRYQVVNTILYHVQKEVKAELESYLVDNELLSKNEHLVNLIIRSAVYRQLHFMWEMEAQAKIVNKLMGKE